MNRSLLFKTVQGLAVSVAMLPMTARAFSPGDTQLLTQMYGVLKEQVDTIKKELEEIKMANEEIFKAREYLEAVRGEYEFATSFNPQGELNSLINWGDGLTNLNGLDDDSWQRNWSLLSDEIDKRFERSTAPGPVRDQNKDAGLEDLNRIQRTRYLQDFYHNQALVEQPATSKDYQRQTASATSMMSSIMLEQRAEKLEKEAARRQALMDGMERDAAFLQYLRGDR